MLHEWLYIGIFLIIALALPAVALILAGVLSPRKPNLIKNSIYECGMETMGVSWIQFKVQYYIYGSPRTPRRFFCDCEILPSILRLR